MTILTLDLYQDDYWAGTGTLRDGRIDDCPAVLGPDLPDHDDDGEPIDTSDERQAACERAYLAIEAALADGATEAAYDGVSYSWTIHVLNDA